MQIKLFILLRINERRSWNNWGNKFETLQFTAKIDGKIIGALEIEGAYHIQSFFIRKEFQKMGIGKKLFNYSKYFFINNGIKVNGYSVYASNYAINFYKKLGFIGDGKHLYLEMSYRRTEKVKLMYNIFLRRLNGLWQMRRRKMAPRLKN
jgi:ribosomal protein S18 acetylase RimI-like enzyme